ncbi:MAG: hydrogenase iron-sulfur subunit [Candidatus Helarchaeota archaeon]
MSFEPKILGFLCNWCSYAGADLAGVSRIQYPPNVRVIRVMCSGRVDPSFIFEALKQGIDGVIVLGCHPGDCHYLTGNYEAEMKMDTVKRLLDIINLSDRIYLDWVSAAEGVRFAEIIKDFTEKIRALGKSPLNQNSPNEEILLDLNAMINATKDSRLRALVGRKRKIINEGNVYNKKIPENEFNNIQDQAIFDEFIRHKILILLKNSSMSVNELSEKLKLDANTILGHIVSLRNRGLIVFDKIDGIVPYYVNIMEGR